MSQENKILDYLLEGKQITPIDALELFGCFRLAARIHTLRKKGWLIQCDDIQSPRNPHVIYGRYWMPGRPLVQQDCNP